jgi:hypothetical protein
LCIAGNYGDEVLTLMQSTAIPRPVSCYKVLEEIACEVHQHPPHCPHLAPGDFHLFGPLKGLMVDHKFEHDKQIQQHVHYFLERLWKTSVQLD